MSQDVALIFAIIVRAHWQTGSALCRKSGASVARIRLRILLAALLLVHLDGDGRMLAAMCKLGVRRRIHQL